MRQACCLFVVSWLLSAHFGCAPYPLGDGRVPPRPLGADLPAHRAPSNPQAAVDAPEAFEEPGGVLNLRRALAAALQNNPDLAAFSWEVRVRDARALGESLLPNPELEIELENFGGSGTTSGFDSAETTVLLSQLIPLAGKIEKRTRVAQLQRDLAGWDYEAARIDVCTAVVRHFVAVAASQERVEFAQKNLGLADQVLDGARKQVEAGAATPLDRTRAAVAVETSRIELTRTQRAMAAAKFRLAATWGSTNPAFDRVEADLESVRPIPPHDQVLNRVDQNPRLMRWAVEISQRRAALELARSRAVPDLRAGAGVRRFEETDETAAVVQFSVPIPIFDRNQAGVLEARFAAAKAAAERRAAQVRVKTELAAAYQELAAAHGEAAALSQTVLPAAAEAFDATTKSYQAGQRSYLEMLDAQRVLFQARAQYIEALATYHPSVAKVEGLIGEPLYDASHTDPSDSEQASQARDAEGAKP